MIIKWTHILIHHSLTEDNKTVSWDAIREYHTKTQGWADIGYHFGMEMGPNNKYLILGGRPLNRTGAHCKEGGMNGKAIGFCFVGNYDLSDPPVPMLVQGAEFILGLMDAFSIPRARVQAHRDYATYKSCPGTKFDMDIFRDLLK